MSYIDKIIKKWSHKVSTGMPDINNFGQKLILRQVLLEEGWDIGSTNTLIDSLSEEFNAIKKDTGNVSTFGTEKARDAAIQKGTHSEIGDDEEPEIKGGDKQDEKGDEKDDEEDTTKKVSTSKTIDRGGDSNIKNQALEYGYKKVYDKNGNLIFKPAPGNAGSLLNEVVSGEVAQMIEENPNLSDEEILDMLYERFGDKELFKSTGKNGNSGTKPAGGIKKSEIPEEHKKNAGLYSKVLLAVRSGRRKHKKAVESAKNQNFKNSKIENYYGHSDSFDAMVNDIKGKQVIGPNGEEISPEEAEQLIRSGGKGDNPSDTATLVFDKDSNKVIMLFHSDKDSTDAIVAQSSAQAEAEANEKNIDKLVQDGKISEEQAEAVKGKNRELVEEISDTEKELKQVVNEPGNWFLENVDTKEALDSVQNDKNPDGSTDGNKTSTKFGGVKNKAGVVPKNQHKSR